MEIRRLSYFVRVAEDGSLMRAAGVLRIAQPALSRQIRLLEEDVGVSLFSRSARGMQLTEEGDYLRAAVAGPLRELELAIQNTRSLASRIEGDFAIGMPSGIGERVAMPLVLQMAAELPHIRLRIVEGPSGGLIDWLNRGLVDFALVEEAPRDDRLSDRALLSEALILVGPADSALMPDRAVPFEEALRLPLIVPSHHLGIRGTLTNAAARARKTINIRLEADSISLIRQLVASGLGYALLPASYCAQERADGTLRHAPIVGPMLSHTIFLAWRKYGNAKRNNAKIIEDTISEKIAAILAGSASNGAA